MHAPSHFDLFYFFTGLDVFLILDWGKIVNTDCVAVLLENITSDQSHGTCRPTYGRQISTVLCILKTNALITHADPRKEALLLQTRIKMSFFYGQRLCHNSCHVPPRWCLWFNDLSLHYVPSCSWRCIKLKIAVSRQLSCNVSRMSSVTHTPSRHPWKSCSIFNYNHGGSDQWDKWNYFAQVHYTRRLNGIQKLPSRHSVKRIKKYSAMANVLFNMVSPHKKK